MNQWVAELFGAANDVVEQFTSGWGKTDNFVSPASRQRLVPAGAGVAPLPPARLSAPGLVAPPAAAAQPRAVTSPAVPPRSASYLPGQGRSVRPS